MVDTWVEEQTKEMLGNLEIWDDPQNMKEVWKVNNVAFVDEAVDVTKVHCTVIQKKKNKPLAWREFTFKWTLNNAQVEEKIASYYIVQWVIGGLKKHVKQYFIDVFTWKIKHEDEEMHFIYELFYDKFRFIIWK